MGEEINIKISGEELYLGMLLPLCVPSDCFKVTYNHKKPLRETFTDYQVERQRDAVSEEGDCHKKMHCNYTDDGSK